MAASKRAKALKIQTESGEGSWVTMAEGEEKCDSRVSWRKRRGSASFYSYQGNYQGNCWTSCSHKSRKIQSNCNQKTKNVAGKYMDFRMYHRVGNKEVNRKYDDKTEENKENIQDEASSNQNHWGDRFRLVYDCRHLWKSFSLEVEWFSLSLSMTVAPLFLCYY